jgi:cold shock CspA family protein
MGKSSGTWNKKELEKKKQQKRKDKEQKKEERKSKAKEGGSLDDMMAYVDENGNLTTTPPDPTKKRVIKDADIRISTPRQEFSKESTLRTGIVTFFNDAKGYGFIKDSESQESIFVHANGLIDLIKDNNKVTFEVERGPRGLSAIGVKILH